MSSEITQFRAPSSLPSHVRTLGLTGSLAYHVAAETAADGHLSPRQGQPGPIDIREAQRALTAAEHACRRAEPTQIAAWLEKFRTLPRAPSTASASQEVVAAMALANGDLPASVWTAETAAEGLRAWQWYPTPAEVRSLLLPHATRFWAQRDGIKRVASTGSPEPIATRTGPTGEAKDHVAAVVRAFAAERSFQAGEPGRSAPVQSRYLSTGALLAAWEKAAEAGAPGAEMRLDMLRLQLAEDAARSQR